MNLRVGLFCLLGGLCFTVPALGVGNFGWWWLSGVVTTAALVPVVRFGPRHGSAQFGAIFLVLVVVGLGCTLSEAVVFFPAMKAQLTASAAGGTVGYLLAAALLVALAKALKLNEAEAPAVAHRPAAWAIPLVLAAGASYVVYYEIFGAITYQFFTKGYYPQAVEQVMAMGMWFFAYQWVRGLLMTLAVLPVIYTLRLRRWQAALAVGLLVWVVGGAGPLLVPTSMMGTAQRFIHIVEIMTQNVSLGMTAVWLLRPRAARTATAMQAVTTA
jgi:hypothetical protein